MMSARAVSTRLDLRAVACALAVGLWLLPAIGSAWQSAARGNLPTSPEDRKLIRQAIASVGLLLVRSSADPPAQALRPRGSAVIVRSDGLVVTNHHVIFDSQTGRFYQDIFIALTEDGAASTAERYRLQPALINKDYDLVLLRIEADKGDSGAPANIFPALAMGNSRRLQLLDDLTVIGFPEKGGTTITLSRGEVQGIDPLNQWIKTDARLLHGNSGGAAVSDEGKLIGIPTKVYADSQPIDKDGDGFPDEYKTYGAVGFLRPAHLVASMIAQLERRTVAGEKSLPPDPAQLKPTPVMSEPGAITLRGVVKTLSGKPIAGARVGLVIFGAREVKTENLLTWAGTNSEGQFVMKAPVPAGRYTLKARALGYEAYSRDVVIELRNQPLVIELRTLSK